MNGAPDKGGLAVFMNRLRILHSIDRHELTALEVGAWSPLP